MYNYRINKKGIALFIVLATIFIVILLANIILSIMSSQSRLTHHQISRIQAYYSTMSGANYAFDKLRRADDLASWYIPASSSSYQFCLSRVAGSCGAAIPDIIDTNLPISVQSILITVASQGAVLPTGDTCNPPAGITVCIYATATYTYTP